MIKSPLLSKTNWVAIITIVIAVLNMTEFQSLFGANGLKYAMLAVGVLTLILRNFFTNQPTTEIAANKPKS
jgi:hypothetical protein